MFIVTARADDQVDGCLVGFATQCSIDPPRYLVCLSKVNRTYDLALRSPALVVHVLHRSPADYDRAKLFGEETGYDVDKLRRCRWDAGPQGVPVLEGSDWFSGPVVDRHDLGDHVGFVVDVTDGHADALDQPCLSYADVEELDAGNPA
jgi:flavin reductase (DIM6/NTAB) family NADH-FMN oxidoreductase RutF